MFPSDDSWIPYIYMAQPRNVSPCWFDIVGDRGHPAAFYSVEGSPPDIVAFRMRLNGNPLRDDSGWYALRSGVWAVLILNPSAVPLYSVRLSALEGDNTLYVIDQRAQEIVYQEPIRLSYPEDPYFDNVRVRNAGSVFSCSGGAADPDYFLDFSVPGGAFEGLFSTSPLYMYYYTSTQISVIDKDSAYLLELGGEKLAGPGTLPVNQVSSWLYRFKLENLGTVTVPIEFTCSINPDLRLSCPIEAEPSQGSIRWLSDSYFAWDIGSLQGEQSAHLNVNCTGSFSYPGSYPFYHCIIHAPAFSRSAYIMDQSPVTVTTDTPLQLSEPVMEGPEDLDRFEVGHWEAVLEVQNQRDTPIEAVRVESNLSPRLMPEAPVRARASAGRVSVTGNLVAWEMDAIPEFESAYLSLGVTGLFLEGGEYPLLTATASGRSVPPVSVASPVITITNTYVPKPVPVHLFVAFSENAEVMMFKENNVRSQETLARLYDRFGRLIRTEIFENQLDLSLEPGSSYVVELLREGYNRKLVVLIVSSEEEIRADIVMEKKRVQVSGSLPAYKADIFEGVVLDKYDADVIFSQDVILPTRAEVDAVYDRVDSVELLVKCQSKLHIRLTVQKQVIYELDGTRQLLTRDYTETFCFPLNHFCENSSLEHKAKVEKVYYCKEGIRLVNNATISLRAYVVDYTDVFIHSKQIPDCE